MRVQALLAYWFLTLSGMQELGDQCKIVCDGDCGNNCTERKENKIFLIYKEIRKGSCAKSYMTKGLPIYWLNICAFSHILGSPYISGNFFFFFYQCWISLEIGWALQSPHTHTGLPMQVKSYAKTTLYWSPSFLHDSGPCGYPSRLWLQPQEGTEQGKRPWWQELWLWGGDNFKECEKSTLLKVLTLTLGFSHEL